MLDVCLLGTGGMMPLPYRALTSMMIRYNGSSILVDCGEGTQVAVKQQGWSFKPIDVILFTHFHADHISGLPGLLLTIGNAERKDPVLMVGPKRLERVVNSLRVIAPELPFEIQFKELTEEEEEFEVCGLRANAYRVNHNVTCYGYSFELDRAGKFDVERARAQEVPMQIWNTLQKGMTIELGGRLYTPDMVMGPDRKGLKVTYCTDTRPTPLITKHAAGSDLFICEGMYGEPDKYEKAVSHKHMTMYEAAEIAKEAEVKQMWLTHYSPSLIKPMQYMDEVRKIFPAAVAGKDRMETTLKFED
ncbi:ribonuclease Z [Clostridium sp. AF15-31]|jgi:ribonuclease Z|nr:ribonuclease Z [Clostridium sp. AF15-31]